MFDQVHAGLFHGDIIYGEAAELGQLDVVDRQLMKANRVYVLFIFALQEWKIIHLQLIDVKLVQPRYDDVI